uniref:Uncharacterized protein n=1 Tax=Utricularia reniformis TaxID=192314 RepID=A0A1Y0B0F7_9LAMI|nr:hypothetical protein AEK19_MT0606 [Utricularia reniformis]ART30861.1 hypothetical protein AEK19_MT0606 [Utricularia reniformis]
MLSPTLTWSRARTISIVPELAIGSIASYCVRTSNNQPVFLNPTQTTNHQAKYC